MDNDVNGDKRGLHLPAPSTSAQPTISPQLHNGIWSYHGSTRPTVSATMFLSSPHRLKQLHILAVRPSSRHSPFNHTTGATTAPPTFSTLTLPLHGILRQPAPPRRRPRPQSPLQSRRSPPLVATTTTIMSQQHSSTKAAPAAVKLKPKPSPPRPSSSILLLSPTNEVLLLHRVQTSSSFPSAHVFPGGNCEAFHDGELAGDSERHADGAVYRWAGVRECFEESGILLAKGRVAVGEAERERARGEVHRGERRFGDVLEGWGVHADLGEKFFPFFFLRVLGRWRGGWLMIS